MALFDSLSPWPITRRSLLKQGLCGAVGLALYSSEIERHWIEVNEREVTLTGLPKVFDGMRIVQLSDIHLDEFTEPFFLRRVIDRVNRMGPEAIFLTGDFVTEILYPRRFSRTAFAGKARKFARGAAWQCADLLREYILRLSNPTFDVTEAVAEVLSENLCALLGVVASNQASLAAPPPSERRLRLEALLAFMRRHTTDPELTPQQAATHLKISVRSVHKLMQETGRSFCAWLLDERINQCIRAIRDPMLRHKRISEIAWSCGFSDVSYFNGVFKSRVGVTPSEVRAGVEIKHS